MRPFQPAALATLPGDLWIEASQVTLGDVTIQRPRFVLRFDNGLVFVEHAEGEWMGGRLTGQATLRRIEAAVSLSTRLALEGGQLARLPSRHRRRWLGRRAYSLMPVRSATALPPS